MSQGDEIGADSPVNVFGMVEGNMDDLYRVRDGAEVIIVRAGEI